MFGHHHCCFDAAITFANSQINNCEKFSPCLYQPATAISGFLVVIIRDEFRRIKMHEFRWSFVGFVAVVVVGSLLFGAFVGDPHLYVMWFPFDDDRVTSVACNLLFDFIVIFIFICIAACKSTTMAATTTALSLLGIFFLFFFFFASSCMTKFPHRKTNTNMQSLFSNFNSACSEVKENRKLGLV